MVQSRELLFGAALTVRLGRALVRLLGLAMRFLRVLGRGGLVTLLVVLGRGLVRLGGGLVVCVLGCGCVPRSAPSRCSLRSDDRRVQMGQGSPGVRNVLRSGLGQCAGGLPSAMLWSTAEGRSRESRERRVRGDLPRKVIEPVRISRSVERSGASLAFGEASLRVESRMRLRVGVRSSSLDGNTHLFRGHRATQTTSVRAPARSASDLVG